MERAIRILEALGRNDEGRPLSELARSLGLSKSTAWGLLGTLERHGLVERDSGTRAYRLGVGLLALGSPILRRLDLNTAARPELERLRDLSGETAILHVPQGEEYVIVERAEPDTQLKVVARAGLRLPAFAGSVAKAFLAARSSEEAGALVRRGPLPAFTERSVTDPDGYLAELDRVRRQGFALEHDEYLLGVRAASVPIRDSSGRAVATISIVGAASRLSERRLRAVVPELVAGAAAVSQDLGAPAEAAA
ncbi:MAG: IclR family transcriptional regulator [Thermoleophilia bacterium]|nr:IclR family transcriptional regulator [Thermoleophilia bacterium]